jgi:outer membrane receptor protein involved in Fe transport
MTAAVLRRLAFVVCCAGWAGVAGAQVSTGGVRGIVRDTTGGVLAGVTIEATSPARMGTAVAVTDAEGAYRFENLPVGVYTITFTLQGFATVKHEDVRVEVGRSVELDPPMSVSAVQETVTVSGDTPVVDTVHAGTSTNFNQEHLANIPTSRNQFFDVVPFAPGAKPTSGALGSGSGFNIFGSDSQQNAFQYDGVDVSAPSFGGPFDWPSFDMMEELQVKAIGASAEFSGFQGGVINLVLKSGSNAWKGSAGFYGIWDPLVDNNTPDEEFPRHVDHRLSYNYTLGGPIVKDRLWVRYSAEHVRWVRSDLGVPPELPDRTRIWRPFVKVDARLSDKDQISAHYNDCRDWWGYGANKTTPPEAASVEVGEDPVVTARWTHIFGSATLFELKTGGVFVRKDYIPTSGDLDTPGHVDLATGNTSVNRAFPNNRDNQNKMNINATLSHTATEFLKGTHEFKFGVQTAPWNEASSRGAYASGQKLYDLAGAPYYALTQEPYALGGRMRTYGVFAQDDWTFSDRVTVNLGLRYDRVKSDVPELEQLDSHFQPTGITFPAVKDLITFDDVSPRLGVNVKLDREGKTVAKAHYGRYYNKLVAPGFWEVSPGNTLLSAFFYNPATRRYDVPYYTIDPKANYGIDPNLSNQWTDQYYVGVERQIQSSFGVTAYFVVKKENNFIRLDDTGGVYAPQPFVDTFNGRTQTITVFNRTSPSAQSLFEVTNRNDLDQDYKTFAIETNKRFSNRWQLQASYQWQRSLIYNRGNIASQGFNTLNRNGYGRDPNDLINAYGRSAVDSRAGVRLSGTWEAPWGIHVGARYYYDAGRPYGRIVNVRLNQGVRPVLAEGRGVYLLPSLNDVGIRLDKDIGFGDASAGRRVRLSLDLINLLNSDTPTNIRNNSSQADYYDGTVGVLNVVEPRRAQVGIRIEF